MAFTKADILAMPGEVVDEYVCEQVLGWARAADVRMGAVSIEATAWVETLGQAEVSRRDGTTASAPQYVVAPVATGTPDFGAESESLRILGAMARAGYQLLFERSADDFKASYVTPPDTHDADSLVTLPSAPDAVRRAALLAVQ